LNIDQSASKAPNQHDGRQEVRNGITTRSWAVATTAASNGSVNACMIPLLLSAAWCRWLMQLGSDFRGAGSGLHGMLMFATRGICVRFNDRPHTRIFGKNRLRDENGGDRYFDSAFARIRRYRSAVMVEPVRHPSSIRAHFSELLYAFSSAGNNNAARLGLSANTPFYNACWAGYAVSRRGWLFRYWPSGSLNKKPYWSRYFHHTPLFVVLIGVVLWSCADVFACSGFGS
jgi:K+-transporting ATPase A subunit